MKCGKCEAELPENAKYCSSCGAKVETGTGKGSTLIGGKQHYGDTVKGDKRTVNTGGGTYIEGGVEVSGGDFVGRDKIITTAGVDADELIRLFEVIYKQIEERPEDEDVGKDELVQAVKNIEGEVNKGEDANPNKVGRWLSSLAGMADDIFEVVVASLTNPAAGIATVIRKVAEKAKEESG